MIIEKIVGNGLALKLHAEDEFGNEKEIKVYLDQENINEIIKQTKS